MAYTRNWLKTQIRSYLKDDTITNDLLDVWIDLSAKRVSQVLECWEMEAEGQNNLVSVSAQNLDGGNAVGGGAIIVDGGDAYNDDPESRPTDYILIPAGIKRVISVQWLNQGVWNNLKAITKHDAYQYKTTGLPSSYLVENRRIKPYPFMDGDYRTIWLKEVVIPDSEILEDALTSYPMIFLNAALAEGYDWKQDAEMMAVYENKWRVDAAEVTSDYQADRIGETLSMRAV